MMKMMLAIASCGALIACASTRVDDGRAANRDTTSSPMNLGAFSVSLTVKDIAASREFYAKLGFEPIGGNPQENWQILRNGDHVIGLFQGMFPRNILTFNPGWTQQATGLAKFTDVREIQDRFKKLGLTLTSEADAASTGPASLMLVDPDGNPILIDQHVPKPR